jgi:ATP-dependent DNA helicase RecQ
MRAVYGVGDVKLRDFGPRFLEAVRDYDEVHGVAATSSFELFRRGATVEEVMAALNRARTTVLDYLAEYIRAERPASIAAWVEDRLYQRVASAARQVGTERLKPVFLALGQEVDYDTIRLVVTHLNGRA